MFESRHSIESTKGSTKNPRWDLYSYIR